MKEKIQSSCLVTLRPDSAVSSQSARSSKQALVRSYDLAKFQRQTIMTPTGFRTMKIYTCPEAERNALEKYKPRPNSALGIMTTTKTKSNKSLSPPDARLLKRASSANELHRDTETETKNQGHSRPSTASSTSSSSRSIIFNSRHPSCSPPDLYRHDNVRAQARKHHPRSATHACEECSSVERYNNTKRRRTRSADVADRFGTPISLPGFVKGNKFLTHEDLDMGQKQYIWGMARVYSVDQLKCLKQRQYNSTLSYEYMKRVISKGVQETDRIKLWKEYLEYQKFIDRFGKDGYMSKDKSACSKYLRSQTHAKKHSIVGWTTEFTDDDVSLNSSLKDGTSETATTDREGQDKDEIQAEGQRLNDGHLRKARPKSSKFRTRRKETPPPDDIEEKRHIMDANDNVDDSLSADVQDKMNIEDTENNFI